MTPHFRRSLFIFRRDLRIEDNTGLRAAMDSSEEVMACFIFDPVLADRERLGFNPHAFQFLLESLDDLSEQLRSGAGRLYLFYGTAEDVVSRLNGKLGIDAVFVNHDYTPFSRRRDEAIKSACIGSGVKFMQFHDCLLHEPGSVLTKQGRPYLVFSQFFRAGSGREVPLPTQLPRTNFYTGEPGIDEFHSFETLLPSRNGRLFSRGGRRNALRILGDLSDFERYGTERDYPFIPGTTVLSAHNKLGTISIREFYHSVRDELGEDHPLLRQLYWRDFFTHTAYHFPDVFSQSFKEKFRSIHWDYDSPYFHAWCTGKTGFPIVDAGMRQLNETGFMHNRVRMITASFLVKDLHMDWYLGERYFASRLVDYDPCVNNGNWQWSASTGADSQPYFRILNPWLQQRKYDPECEYVRQWVPELREMSAAEIHGLEKNEPPASSGYPPAMADHKTERERTLAVFGSL
ncbi:MAG: deoxyribodipyrimidine photo-lyase [Methanolobus sp.]|nr:deoxyribodipyrimidine photo-lyase [Methanolobus sp.]MDK2912211.1 deoxyribodipyrimidine photo-lyase [Methanolobus sp.]MDN5310276.1 deoxyribodipyrimidine photo-lyase [Methanolobus sp.]